MTRFRCLVLVVFAAVGSSADSASATTIQHYRTAGTPGWVTTPATTSIGIPANSAVNAALSAPGNSTSCVKGQLAGALGSNPATTVSVTPTQLTLGTCTDTTPNCDTQGLTLQTPGSATLAYSAGTPNGSLALTGATLRVVRSCGGVLVPCTLRAVDVSGDNVAVGAITNPTGTPPGSTGSVKFTNVKLQTTVTTGSCAAFYGGLGGSSASFLTVTFSPLQVLAVASGQPTSDVGARIRIQP